MTEECIGEKRVSIIERNKIFVYYFKMEKEVSKAINTTVFKEYGNPDHSKVTEAINFAQEKVIIGLGKQPFDF